MESGHQYQYTIGPDSDQCVHTDTAKPTATAVTSDGRRCTDTSQHTVVAATANSWVTSTAAAR